MWHDYQEDNLRFDKHFNTSSLWNVVQWRKLLKLTGTTINNFVTVIINKCRQITETVVYDERYAIIMVANLNF